MPTSAGKAKLADFGVSEIINHGRGGDYMKVSGGTPAFFAPEMCSSPSGDKRVGPVMYSGKAADMWAVGVCVYSAPLLARSLARLPARLTASHTLFGSQIAPHKQVCVLACVPACCSRVSRTPLLAAPQCGCTTSFRSTRRRR